MTDSPTLPMQAVALLSPIDPATMPMRPIKLSRTTVRSLRRQTVNRTQRQRDLELASLGQVLERSEAIEICARMAGWIDRTEEETDAVHELRERHDISLTTIRAAQRARDIPVSDAPPLRRYSRRR